MRKILKTFAVAAFALFAMGASNPANIAAVPSMAVLQSFTAPVMAQYSTLQVVDFYANSQTNGGGTFKWFGAGKCPAIASDGGVVVAPAGQSGSVSQGCMVRQPMGQKAMPQWWGAYGDAISILSSTSITSGSNVLTLATGNFTASDADPTNKKIIQIPGAGTGGDLLRTTISTYISPTQVQLTDAAQTTVTAQNYVVTYGHNDTAGINGGLAYLSSTTSPTYTQQLQKGGCLYLPRGSYFYDGTLRLNSNVCLLGEGPLMTQIGVPGSSAPTSFPVQALSTPGQKICCTAIFPVSPLTTAMIDTAPFYTAAIPGDSGTAQGGGTNAGGFCGNAPYITLQASASSTNNFYSGNTITITGGTGANQTRTGGCYDGTLKRLVVSWPYVVVPDNTSVYSMPAKNIGDRYTSLIGLTELNCVPAQAPQLNYVVGLKVDGINLVSNSSSVARDYEGYRFLCAAHAPIKNIGAFGFQIGCEFSAVAYLSIDNTYCVGTMVDSAFMATDQLAVSNSGNFGGVFDTITSTNKPWFMEMQGADGFDPHSNFNTAVYSFFDDNSTFNTINGEEFTRSFFFSSPNATVINGLHMENWTASCPFYVQGGNMAIRGITLSENTANQAFCGVNPILTLDNILNIGGSNGSPSILGPISCQYGGSIRIYQSPPFSGDVPPDGNSCIYWDNYGRPFSQALSTPYSMNGYQHMVLKYFAGAATVNLPPTACGTSCIPVIHNGWCAVIGNATGDAVTITVATPDAVPIVGSTSITGGYGSQAYVFEGSNFQAIGACPPQANSP
jgi:hypothetical protein